MKTSNLIFTTAALLTMTAFLTACPAKTRKGQTVYEYEQIPGRDMNDGGSDTGGGAGAKGQMLESYREKDFTNKEPFKSRIRPIIQAIADKDPAFAGDLMHIAVHRRWYFMPIDLAKIPPADMISTIRGGNVDQVAIQNEGEVWFDSREYAGFTEDHRVDALIHELVMGVRLMEFQKAYDHCLAEASRKLIFDSEENRQHYNNERRNCANQRLNEAVSVGLGRTTRKLNEQDYISVRKVTTQLADLVNVSKEELRMLRQLELRR